MFSLGLINCLIRETLTGETSQRDRSALFVIVAKLNASVLAEIKLSQIAVQVLAIDVLIDTDKAALHNAKEAFKRVHMHIATHVLAFRVVNAFMRRDRRELVSTGPCH